MKISIIIPVYNCEEYVANCLDSILNQTYQNFEIIIVNDGSTDRSSEICNKYVQRDMRVSIIHQCNHGVSHARNTGLEVASGDVISFIDADDTLEPDMYELLIENMIKYDADISHCGFNRVESGHIKPLHDTKKVCVQNSEQAINSLLRGDLFNGALWNKIFKTQIITDLTLREELKINEDILFCFEAFRKSRQSVFADCAKYNYCVRESASACFVTPKQKQMQDGLWVSKYIYEHLMDSPLESLAADRYLRVLATLLRYQLRSHISKNETQAQIWKIYKRNPCVSKRMAIAAVMIHICPKLYGYMYKFYDRVRKPEWGI